MINPTELSTDELYFADKHYMSVSAFKKLSKCELDGLTDWGSPSDSMLVGSYVDAFISGTIDKFKEDHPEIISSRGSSKGELKTEFKKADEICDYIVSNPRLSQFLSGEKQTIMTGEIAGVPFKIKMDSYSKGIAIVDLKVMASVTDKLGNPIDFITPWGYDIQLACYQEIVRQNTGELLPCFIVAVTKETPIDSLIVNIDQDFLYRALGKVETEIKHLYDVKMKVVEPVGCGVCSTCRLNRKDTRIIALSEIYRG